MNNSYERILRRYHGYVNEVKLYKSKGLLAEYSESMIEQLKIKWPTIQYDYELWLALK